MYTCGNSAYQDLPVPLSFRFMASRWQNYLLAIWPDRMWPAVWRHIRVPISTAHTSHIAGTTFHKASHRSPLSPVMQHTPAGTNGSTYILYSAPNTTSSQGYPREYCTYIASSLDIQLTVFGYQTPSIHGPEVRVTHTTPTPQPTS